MILKSLKLKNFRKYEKLDLIFSEGLNLLIGENDSGKTAIIDAIKLVLKTHSYEWIRVKESDFFNESNNFRIELKFTNLTDLEASHFTEWLGWEGEGENIKTYLKVIYDVTRNDDRILPADIKAGADYEGYPLNAEAREYLKTTYLKPLRDAESELISKKYSRLSQIMLSHKAFKNKTSHNFIQLQADFNKSISNYFIGKDESGEQDIPDQKGKKLKDDIDIFIHDFFNPETRTEFKTSETNLRSILEKLALNIENIKNPGLGSLNRLFMAAELLHLKKENWSGLRLGLIEELEAHLHPQVQMKVIESLQEEKEIQLILTTHSPNLASKVELKNLIICDGTNAFPMGSDYTELESDDYCHLERFLDVTKSNLFFAKGVILVEGWSEEILIPALAKNLGYDLTKNEVSIVNIGNVGFDHYSRIFLRKEEPYMNFPVSVVTDVDIRTHKKEPETDANGKIIKESGKIKYKYTKIDEETVRRDSQAKKATKEMQYKFQKVQAFIAENWTLEYCLFKSTALSSIFKEVVESIHSGTDWTNFETELAKKLINKGLKKTEIAYQLADKIEKMTSTVDINDNDSINYLVGAIKYACSN